MSINPEIYERIHTKEISNVPDLNLNLVQSTYPKNTNDFVDSLL